ncbi:MAG: EAL domain-containing protein [Rhodobacteraceae bacterium]|nr:EAL domain-containing protein [Paracoccaceae bacterium]
MEQPPRLDAFAYLKSLAAGEVPALTTRIEANARIRFTVAQALAQGRLGFHFQPVVRATNPRFPAFFEMLARLTLPSGQILPAAAFLPHVEDHPLGRAIDRAALASACAALAQHPALRLSVNLSPRAMGDADWLAILARAAATDRRVTGRLVIEITETAALEHSDQTLDFLDHARGFGCAFALDDFGAGATGFRHFRDFRFDMVKIDGAFVQGVSRSPDARVLVECLVKLARHFEMLTIAERVECAADAEVLRSLGVDCLQGYLLGRPAALPDTPSAEAARKAG